MAWWHNMATWIGANIGSADSLLPAGTKPLSKPMLNLWSSVAFAWKQCWISEVLHHSIESNVTVGDQTTIEFESHSYKINATLPVAVVTIILDMGHDDVIKWHHFPRYWPFMRGITGEFCVQRPMKLGFDVFFDPHLNKCLSKQWWG